MDKIKSYRDLIAWQKAMDLVVSVYRETASLPQSEQYGLTAQMRKSAVSVPSNVAEGWGRNATQDYLRFLRVARASLFELTTQVEICDRLGFAGNWDSITADADEVRRVLHRLIRSIGS